MNTNNSHLVPIKNSEAEKISSMAHLIWPVVYAGMISKEQILFMLEWMYAPSQIKDDMNRGVLYHWIEMEGRRVGFTAFGPVRKNGSCEIHKLYILPGHHRCGLGIQSLQQVEKIAAASDASMLYLRVNRNNQPAIALYRKAGFTKVKEDIKDIGNDFVMDDFIFQKEISAASG